MQMSHHTVGRGIEPCFKPGIEVRVSGYLFDGALSFAGRLRLG